MRAKTFLLFIQLHEEGERKGGFGKRHFAHVNRCIDELCTSQNRKYHPLNVGGSEKLCETVPWSAK